jgi:transposase
MGIIRSVAERTRLVEAYRASGLSVSVFGRREGLSESTLYQWLVKHPPPPKSMRLARVIRRRAPVDRPLRPMQASVIVEVGAVRLHVAAGFDTATVTALLDVLEERVRGAQR